MCTSIHVEKFVFGYVLFLLVGMVTSCLDISLLQRCDLHIYIKGI